MPSFCCVVGCGSRGERDLVSFFRIPTVLQFAHKVEVNELSRLRREKWLSAIKRNDLTESKIKHARVCGKHFVSGKPAALNDRDDPDWVPSIKMGQGEHKNIRKRKAAIRCDKLFEKGIRKKNSSESDASTISLEQPDNLVEVFVGEIQQNCASSVYTQTDLTMGNLNGLFVDLSVSEELKKRLSRIELSCNSLKNKNLKTEYYTGFDSYSSFEEILNQLKPFLGTQCDTKLAANEQILLTLAKLKLNLDLQDLAYRFDINLSTASAYFKTVIDVMYHRFQELVAWPKREKQLKTMPQCFKDAFHDNSVVIIDCFEISIEKPSTESWSHCKDHQTIKYLIAITPQGTVSFISKGWEDKTSDEFLKINSKFLSLLGPGDVILADRDVLIDEFLQVSKATVRTTAFKKGGQQMHPVNLEESNSISNARTHVEGVIRLTRQKYKILAGATPLPCVMGKWIDKIVFVCCALINLCPPVVPLE